MAGPESDDSPENADRKGVSMSEIVTSVGSDRGREELVGCFDAVINRRPIVFPAPSLLGREVLSGAGDVPPDDFVLIALEAHGTRSVRLDERVDLGKPGCHEFRSFRGDRIFLFTINEREFEWGAPLISEPDLREIGHVPEDDVLVLKRDGSDVLLRPDFTLDLARPGTEHLSTRRRLVKVFYDTDPRRIPVGVYTTEQLMAEFAVPAGYLLNVVDEHGQLVTLKPHQRLRVHEGQKFFSQVPSGSSS
jgi:hypothetical protein